MAKDNPARSILKNKCLTNKFYSMKKPLLLFAWLLTASAVQAQHMQPDPVEPASKGVLPEMPVVDLAAE